MENDNKKIKEPFTPENTPTPPQIIAPNERNNDPTEKVPMKTAKSPSGEKKAERKNQKPTDPKKEEKPEGESVSEITETTA